MADDVNIFDDLDEAVDGNGSYEFGLDAIDDEEGSEPAESELEEDILTEYGIDFATGKLTGQKVTGLDAIKVWIWNALKTARFRYEIFTDEYGSELDSLIGQVNSKEYIESEVKRMCEECLDNNKYIEELTDFDIKIDGNKLNCAFTVITTLGRGEMNVTI